MKLLATLGKGLLAAGTVAAGIGTGGWINERVHAPQSRVQQTDNATGAAPASSLAEPATPDSLFHYKFTAGERLDYALDAAISGTGVEAMAGPGAVAMQFESDMHVHTDSVDLSGNGNLTIGFDRVEMHGSFMDQPVDLVHSMSGTEFSHGRDRISTAAGDSTKGVPQLAFFNTPTEAKVSPAGEVIRVEGAPGMDKLLSPEEIVSGVEFPAGELDAGAQWESDFAMPVPGLGTPAAAKAINVLEGFELFRGRYCGVIRQTIKADQQDGTMESPESALGEEMNFSLPEFRLSGENLIYFDVDNGHLVQADMNLDFTMRIGEQRKPLADALNVYGKLLNELEGGGPDEAQNEDLLDLGVNIQSTLSLLE